MFFAKKRAIANAAKSSNARILFTSTLNIPGYSDASPHNPLVFIQPGEIYAPGGVKCDAILRHSVNFDFIERYGEYYFIVGNHFAKLTNKMQLAILQYEAARSGFDAKLTFGIDYASGGHAALHTTLDDDFIVQEHSSVVATEAVASALDAHIAKQVNKRVLSQEKAAASRNAVFMDSLRKSLIASGAIAAYKKAPQYGLIKKGQKQAAKEAKQAGKGVIAQGNMPPMGPIAATVNDPLEKVAATLQTVGEQVVEVVEELAKAPTPDTTTTPPTAPAET